MRSADLRPRLIGVRLVGMASRSWRTSWRSAQRLEVQAQFLQCSHDKRTGGQAVLDRRMRLDARGGADDLAILCDSGGKGLGNVHSLATLRQHLHPGCVADIVFSEHATPQSLAVSAKRPSRLLKNVFRGVK